ncbi:MAG: SusC/RagA family TonB-linked outer membrane protein [Saprospiraceae bacterium]
MLRNSLSCCLFLFALIAAQAQSDISGLVLDGMTNKPLTGATIVVEGTTNAAISDGQGQFQLKQVLPNAYLLVDFLGYKRARVAVNNQQQIEISLVENIAFMEEVVVTALGLERSSKQLGYSVEQLDGADISEVKSANLVQTLAGKIAGVTVTQGATGIGSSSKITIRGEASFTNNSPLFVVDGTPISNRTVFNQTNEAAAGFQEVDFGNGAMDVNPDDIASISILKGPSAAALYGTRASNGVILITTKKGREEKGLDVSFNSSFSIETPFQLPKFQNQYGQGNSGQFEFVDGLGGGVNDNNTYSWGPRLDAGILIPQFDSPVTLLNGSVVRGGDVAVHGGAPITATPFISHPDNLKDFYRTGTTLTNNLAFGGGFAKGGYRLSLTDMRNTSIIPGSNLERQTVSANLSFLPTEKWEINSSFSYINTQSDNRPANGYGSENVNYSLVAWGPRSLDIKALRDYWQPGLEGLQQYSFNYTFFDNPYFILQENRNAFDRHRLFGNLSVQHILDEHWSIRASTGLDRLDEDRTFRRHFSSNRFSKGAYAEQAISYQERNSDLQVNYTNRLGDFGFDVIAGANRMDLTATSQQLQTLALAQPGIFNLGNAAAPVAAFPFDNEKRINSIFAVAKMDFLNCIFLEITGRNDWSSALATPASADNVSFFYPSVSTSVLLSDIFSLPAKISFAKVRASWAQVGNDTDPYQTSGAFVAQTPFLSQPTFSAQNVIANNHLKPEKTTAVELGADVRFFDDRLSLDLTYYNALTNNQIISLPVAISSGYEQQVVNGGAVRSEGVEMFFGATPILTPDFSWKSAVNFSHNTTRVEDLPNEIEGRLTLAYSRVYDNVNQTVWHQVDEGGRVGDLYGTGYLKNDNGDFVIDQNGRYIVDNTLKKLGNYNPDFIVGWSNQLRFKNWQLGFLLDWRQGGILVSRTLALAGVGGQLEETANRPEAGIVAEGVVKFGMAGDEQFLPNTTAIPAETYYRQYYDRNHEENNTYDASYVKLREFSLSYTFPKVGSKRMDVQNLRISLFGRNLFALSDIPHFDPEQLAVQGTGFISGVEDMSYATSRSIGVKVSLNL